MATTTDRAARTPSANGTVAPKPPLGEMATIERPNVFKALFFPDVSILEGTIGKGEDTIFLNPDPIVRDEGNELGVGLYDDVMDKDDRLSGYFDTRTNAVVAVPWEITPGGDTPEHADRAALVRWAFEQIPYFDEARRAMLEDTAKGYSVTEIVWGGVDGYTVPVKLKDLDQRLFVFDLLWRPRMLRSGSPMDNDLVHPSKVLVQRHKAKAWNPYGIGLMRRAYYRYMVKKHLENIWAAYCEKFGQPTVEGIYNQTARADRQKALKIAEDAVTALAVVHDDQLTLKAIEGLAKSGDVEGFDRLINRIDDSQAILICGQVLSSQPRATGMNSGVATLQSEVRADLIKYDAGRNGGCLSEACRMIEDYNFGGPPSDGRYSTFSVLTDPPEDRTQEADILTKAVDIGMDVPRGYAHEKLAIPEPEPGEDVLSKPTPPPSPFLPPGLGGGGGANGKAGGTKPMLPDGTPDTGTQEEAQSLRYGDPLPGLAQLDREEQDTLRGLTPMVVDVIDELQQSILRAARQGKRSGSRSSE